jgi:TRAP-type C4-dicarboxylate transport system permease small subunit
MKIIQNVVFTISRYAAYLAAAICIYMLVHILLEIVVRSFLGTSTYCMDEFVGYAVGTMAFLALGYSLETGALIRVNLLLKHLDGWIRRGVELFCCVTTLLGMAVPMYYFFVSARRFYIRGTTSATWADVPTWIPEACFLVGMVLFWIQLLAYTLRVVTGQIDLRTERAVQLGADS